MTNNDIVKTLFLPIAPKAAWAYLTEPDKLAKWFHAPKVALADGADYALHGRDSGDKMCWGKVTTMTPHSHLTYTFSITPAPDLETIVDWTLEEVAGGTKITLRHSGFDGVGADGFGLIMALDNGWEKHFGELREAL